nr:plasmid maintenance protein kleG [imported] - Enterobacter aerogenes [Klebsiella aerogenes]
MRHSSIDAKGEELALQRATLAVIADGLGLPAKACASRRRWRPAGRVLRPGRTRTGQLWRARWIRPLATGAGDGRNGIGHRQRAEQIFSR